MALGQLGLLQGLVGLDHPLQLVLGRAVAAVGVGMAALDQLVVAARGSLGLSAVASRSRSARALRSSLPRRRSLAAAVARPGRWPAEHAERIGEARRGRRRRGLAVDPRGLERPGRAPAGGLSSPAGGAISSSLMPAKKFQLRLYSRRVRLAEPVVLAEAGRATSGRGLAPAAGSPGGRRAARPA